MAEETLQTGTLVVGAGFAGLSVAARLPPGEAIIVDRGEPFDMADAAGGFRIEQLKSHFHQFPDALEAEARQHQSSLPGNRQPFPLSVMTSNMYAHRQGGISNWWGGYAARITRETFARDGVITWPFGLDQLDPYYAESEQALRVHGDPTRTDATVFGETPGWKLWKDYAASVFPKARLNNVAKNVSGGGDPRFGTCTGHGHCALCPNDARARPGNVFPDLDVFHSTRVDEIIFDGERAVAARCFADGQAFTVQFSRLVLATGGLDTLGLLRRSKLPAGVRADLMGNWYQDHAAAEIIVEMHADMPYQNVAAESHLELPELSGYINGVEVETLLLSVPPRKDYLRHLVQDQVSATALNVPKAARRIARLYLQMEVPPEWNLRARSNGQATFIDTLPYLENTPVLDGVVDEVLKLLVAKGIRPLVVEPYYRMGFGGHHYSGYLPMSGNANAVVEPDHRLIGSSNIYVNGASVIPRCGGAGPTLTIVALGFRLGDILKAQPV